MNSQIITTKPSTPLNFLTAPSPLPSIQTSNSITTALQHLPTLFQTPATLLHIALPTLPDIIADLLSLPFIPTPTFPAPTPPIFWYNDDMISTSGGQPSSRQSQTASTFSSPQNPAPSSLTPISSTPQTSKTSLSQFASPTSQKTSATPATSQTPQTSDAHYLATLSAQRATAAAIAREKVLAAYNQPSSTPLAAYNQPNSTPHPSTSPLTTNPSTSTSASISTFANPARHATSASDWQKYHTAWQNYYQKYYNDYYANAARTYLETAALKKARAAADERQLLKSLQISPDHASDFITDSDHLTPQNPTAQTPQISPSNPQTPSSNPLLKMSTVIQQKGNKSTTTTQSSQPHRQSPLSPQTPYPITTLEQEDDIYDSVSATLKSRLQKTAITHAKRHRKARRLLPLFVGALVTLSILFLQYNRLIFAPIIAYVSPGNAPIDAISEIDPTITRAPSPDPKLIIPKLNINVPVAFGIDNSEPVIMNAMNHGVAHFMIPGASAFPGQIGNTVITGHSAGDIYSNNQYKFIFSGLERLGEKDLLYVNYLSKRYTYSVTKKEVINPNEVHKLVYPTEKPVLTLITCTPLGTARQRLLVTAEQINPSDTTSAPTANPIPPKEPTALPSAEPSFFEKTWRFFTRQ